MAQDINLTPTGSYFDIVASKSGNGDLSGPMHYLPHLTGRTWGLPTTCRKAVLLVHGLGAHSGWFEAFSRRLKVRQIFALAYDQVGFGKRRKEPFFSRKQWILDLEAAYNHLLCLVGDKPIYLLGNSMGAVVAFKAAIKIKPAGLVMFSPGFEGNPLSFNIWYRVSHLVKAFFQPDSEIDLPYTTKQVTDSEAVQKWLENDGDRRFRLPARMMLELLHLSQDVERNVREVQCPVLMFTAGLDQIVDNKAAKRMFARLASAGKSSRDFSEAFHDLMFDQSIDVLVEEMLTWIDQTAEAKILTS